MSGERRKGEMETKEFHEDQLLETSPLLFSYRSLISVIMWSYTMLTYMQRFNLSVAIVCMINHTDLSLKVGGETGKTVKFSDCGQDNISETVDMEDGELLWSKDVQGLVLSSFFWGYITTQVAGGALSLRFGSRIILGSVMLIASVATMLTPVAARLHYGALMALRILMGMCQGAVFPATHTFFSRWAPPAERNRLIGMALGGANVGSVLSMLFGGLLCQYGFAGGWPSVFYVPGMLGIALVIVWFIFVTDGPKTNRWINATEADYIERSLRERVTQEKVFKVPVRQILTSLPVWALVVTHTCSDWGNYIFLTQLPTYLREVTGFAITKNGILSALPYILKIGVVIIVTCTADFLKSRKLSYTIIRKVFNSSGLLPLAAFSIATTLLPCALKNVAVGFLVTGIAFTGCTHAAGYSLNPTDIAPQFAGVLFGISNTVGTISGMVGPSVVSALTPQRTRLQWNNVFYLTAGIYTFGALFFIVFGSGELQAWGRPKSENDEKPSERKTADGADASV